MRFDLFSQMHRTDKLTAENASSVGRYELTRDENAEFFSRSKLRHVLSWGRREEGPLFDPVSDLYHKDRERGRE